MIAPFLLAAWLGMARQAATPAALQASGFNHFYNLELDASIADFRELAGIEPESAAAQNHLAQALIYKEMLRIGALESQLYGHGDPFLEARLLPPSPAAEESFEAVNHHAMELAEQAIRAHPDDAHAEYDLATAWAMRGTFDFVLRKSYLAALGDARKARAADERAAALAPAWVDARLILGVHNYVAGSLPVTAKVFSAVLGYRGDKEKGRAEILDVAEHGENARNDARVFLVILDRRDGHNRDAIPLLEELATEYPRNPLFAVELAECEEAAGEHENARAQYLEVVRRALTHQPGFTDAPLDKVWYDLGNIERLFSRWEPALDDYAHAAATPNAQPRYRQAALLAAGQIKHRLGDQVGAKKLLEECAAIDPVSQAGKEATKEADIP